MNPDDNLLDAAWDREDIFDDVDDAEAADFWAETDGWFADHKEVYCSICNCHNGHSLSCAVLNANGKTIDGDKAREIVYLPAEGGCGREL